jgi:5'-deoxynucleotidase YfbR-like HD superfamily hydrolase
LKVTLETWLANRVRRWHTHPDLATTPDTIDGHQARVAQLLLMFWPTISRDALCEALTHDLGEHAVGDMSYLVKKESPELAALCAHFEMRARRTLGALCEVSKSDKERIALCDRLDAYLWAHHHRPDLMARPEWHAMLDAIFDAADRLAVTRQVRTLLIEADVRAGIKSKNVTF